MVSVSDTRAQLGEANSRSHSRVSLVNHDYITETVFNRVSTSPSAGPWCIASLASYARPLALT